MKKILIVVSFAIILLFGGLISLPYWFDINDYKDQITSAIKEKSGADIQVKGEITVRALPDLALTLNEVSLLSSFGNGENVFSASGLVLKIKLLPLLKKKLEIDSLKFLNPIFNLHIKSGGSKNWELKGSDVEVVTEISDDVTELSYIEEEVVGDYLYNSFTLNELIIKNGSLSLLDEKSGQDIKIENINLNTSVKPGDNDFSLSGKANLFENKEKGKFSIGGLYFIGHEKYNVDNILLKLDDIEAHSNIVIDLGMGHPSFKVALYTSYININDYKLVSKDKKTAIVSDGASSPTPYEQQKEKFSWSNEAFDLAGLNSVDIDFNFKTSGITFEDISFGETVIYSYLRNGRLTVNLKDSSLYGGLINSEIVVDTASGLPTIKSDIGFENIDLKKLPEKVAGADGIGGKVSGDIKVYSVGNTQKNLIGNMNGKARLNAVNGEIKGLDLFSMVKNVTSAFKVGNFSGSTRFEKISGDFQITNGLVSNDNFVLKSDILNFEGAGNFDLKDLSIDYKLIPKYSHNFESTELAGPKVPIVISGDITHPVFRLEVKSIVQDLINNPKGGENLVKQLKRDLKEIKNDFNKNTIKDLKDLFN